MHLHCMHSTIGFRIQLYNFVSYDVYIVVIELVFSTDYDKSMQLKRLDSRERSVGSHSHKTLRNHQSEVDTFIMIISSYSLPLDIALGNV